MFETNLKAYSFEVVVAGQVLHLQGCSFEDSLRWIATLKAAINNSPPDDTDPLLAEALRLEDTFYYVRVSRVVFTDELVLGVQRRVCSLEGTFSATREAAEVVGPCWGTTARVVFEDTLYRVRRSCDGLGTCTTACSFGDTF